MKVIKPLRLGVLSRTFEHDRTVMFCVSVLAFVPLSNPSVLLPEASLWKLIGSRVGRDVAPDMCMPKSRGELLLAAECHPAGGKPAGACTVRARVGTIDKSLLVVGNRHWKAASVSTPEPFTSMPITWDRAFGGPTFERNPLGRGMPETADKAERVFLPNIELPKSPVRGPNERPEPASFGAIDFAWPRRMSKAGTHDKAWLENYFPGLARDIDWTIFNAAPDDQQLRQGFFSGDEEFSFEGMHPTLARLSGRLPGYIGRAFVTMQSKQETEFREIRTRLDTVYAFPQDDRALLIFRGVTKVQEDDAYDVVHLVVGADRQDAPRDIEHYQSILENRLDPEYGALRSLVDDDLIPPVPVLASAQQDSDDLSTATKREGLLDKNMRERAVREVAARKQAMAALGLPPEENIPPIPAIDDTDPMDAANIEKQIKEALAARTKASEDRKKLQAERKQLLKDEGIDVDKLVEETPTGGPPTFRAVEQKRQLLEARATLVDMGVPTDTIDQKLADPRLDASLSQAESSLFENYRRNGHHMPPAPTLIPEKSEALRNELKNELAYGRSLAGRDFTGANLSGINLSGADLRGCFFECADLTNADLSRCNLTDAMFARANLTNANLDRSTLVQANLGFAMLKNTVITDADLTRAVLYKASLLQTKLDGSTLTGADLLEATFVQASLQRVTANEVILLRSDLSKADLRGIVMMKANIIECVLDDVDLREATLTGTVMVETHATGMQALRARCDNLRVVKNCDLSNSNFEGANLQGANLRSTKLSGCRFARANLDGADLSESALSGTSFHQATARDAAFVRSDLTDAMLVAANLMGAVMQKATLHGAVFRGANLFRVDFARVRGGAKDLTDALTTKANVYPRLRTQ